MSSDDTTKDLALDDGDAENILGGTRKKVAKPAAKKVSNPQHSTGHSLPSITIQAPMTPVEEANTSDTDNPDEC
jgi:hypothetical protein